MSQPALPLRPRHYPKTERLVLRTVADQPEIFGPTRLLAMPMLESLLLRPDQPALVATADGGIARLLLTVPVYAVHSPALAAVYVDLVRQLPASTRLLVLTHESVLDDVQRWLSTREPASVEVVAAPDHLHFSVWAEDGYAAVSDSSGAAFLIEPFAFPRYGDSLVADMVANATDLQQSQAPLYFQGGNILVGDDFFLIGADYPANTLGYIGSVLGPPASGQSTAEYVRALYKEYLDVGRDLHFVASTVPVPAETSRAFELEGEQWTELLYLGNKVGTAQPLFHIDMFISLAGRGDDGRYRLLVGDPRLAAELLDTPLPPHAMAGVFDNIARGLGRSASFDVQRNPLPLVYVDDVGNRTRSWYFATANNALVSDEGSGERTVYLPTYGHGEWQELQVTDKRNLDTWRELGFQPRALPDFHPFAENLGAVHCIKKFLARS